MKKTTIRLPDKLTEAIHSRAIDQGRTPSDIIRHTLNSEFGFPDTPKLNAKTNPKLALK